MKPVLTFALGALLASAIAVFVVNRKPAEPTVASIATTAAPAESPVVAEPEPAPVHEAPIASAPKNNGGFSSARPERRPSRPTSSSSTITSTATAPAPRPSSTTTQSPDTSSSSSAPQSTTSTTAQVGGPPQTTLSMPPPPDSSRAVDSTPAPPPRVPKTVTIPAGTLLSVRIDDRLSTDTVHTGDSFRATLDQPLVIDGAVVAERGARIEGRITESDRGGKVSGLATLALELVRLNTSDGQRVPVQTEGFTKTAEKSTKKDAAKVGIGAGLGAAIGAIAGGGKGAAIGAGVGGAAGTGAVLTSRGQAAEVTPETRMAFRLREPVTLTEKFN